MNGQTKEGGVHAAPDVAVLCCITHVVLHVKGTVFSRYLVCTVILASSTVTILQGVSAVEY